MCGCRGGGCGYVYYFVRVGALLRISMVLHNLCNAKKQNIKISVGK